MQKVALIFTAATGGGHNQAAEALKYRLEQQGVDVKIVHLLKSCPKVVEALVESGYTFMATYFSRFYGGLYHFSHHYHINNNLKKMVLKLTKAQMTEQIQRFNPSLLISTHPFFVNPMAELKKEGATDAKCLSVITDLGVHRFYLNPSIDAYITGSKYTNDQLVQYGISQERIFDFGIPVSEQFYTTQTDPNVSDQKPFKVLVMSGSMGSYKLIPLMQSLKKIKKPIHIDLVCGNNKALFDHLEKQLPQFPNRIRLNLHRYVHNVDALMGEADLLISKPGGLTLTEAIYKDLPMVIPFFIQGQEAENAEILSSLGVAIKLDKPRYIHQLIDRIMDEPILLEKMHFNIRQISENYSMDEIDNLMSKLIAS